MRDREHQLPIQLTALDKACLMDEAFLWKQRAMIKQFCSHLELILLDVFSCGECFPFPALLPRQVLHKG